MDNAPVRRGAVMAAALLASVTVLRGDTAPKSRAVIRGTGSDVTIVYETPRTRATEVQATVAEDPIAQALRRKAAGEDDAAIVAFLRLHQASFPEVIDSDVIQEFRLAGAGQDVISVLLQYTAVDIGPTSEDAEVQPMPAAQTAYAGAWPDLAGMGYPFYGDYGYGGGYFGGGYGGGRHFGKPDFGRHDGPGRPVFHSGRPAHPQRPPVAPSRSHGLGKKAH
jgi:hypothetical protein